MVDELAALIVQGALRLLPIEVIPWQEIPAGLHRLANGHVRGKIVAQSQNELGSASGGMARTFKRGPAAGKGSPRRTAGMHAHRRGRRESTRGRNPLRVRGHVLGRISTTRLSATASSSWPGALPGRQEACRLTCSSVLPEGGPQGLLLSRMGPVPISEDCKIGLIQRQETNVVSSRVLLRAQNAAILTQARRHRVSTDNHYEGLP